MMGCVQETVTYAQKARGRRPYRLLHEVVTRGEPAIRRAFLSAIAAVRDGTSIAAVRDAIERGDYDGAVAAIPWGFLEADEPRGQLTLALQKVFDAGAEVGIELIRGVNTNEFTLIEDPRWLRAVEQHGARRVVEIGRDMRATVRDALVKMADSGMNATDAARAIRDTHIGLHERWSLAVENYRAQLQEAGRKASDVKKFTAQYSERLLNARALSIARTEAQFMAAEGKRAAWDQAAEDGLFEPASAQREWIASPDACPEICAPLDGVRVGMDEDFPGGIKSEPAHVNCTCATEIVIE